MTSDRSAGVEESALSERVFARLDEELFRAWQANDARARVAAWTHLSQVMYTAAVALCRFGAPDQQTAEEWAFEAVTDAWLEVERKIRDGYVWGGEGRFTGLMNAYVVFQVRRRLKKHFRLEARIDHLLGVPDDERDSRVEELAATSAMQGARQFAVDTTRESIGHLVDRLAIVRGICRPRKALTDVVDEMVNYIHECCRRAVVGVDTTAMTIDEVVSVMDPDIFDASSEEMNRTIMQRLKISRNTLDTRRADIRARLARLGVDDAAVRESGVST